MAKDRSEVAQGRHQSADPGLVTTFSSGPAPAQAAAANHAATQPSRQVSVIVAARNAQDTIARAVRSALDQPSTLEVLVVSDGSSDLTAARAQALDPGGQRVRVIDLEHNVGPAAARNLALDQARGEMVTILDADDFMLPGRLEALIADMGQADMAADDLALSDETTPLRLRGRLVAWTGVAPLNLERFAYGNIGKPGERRRELGFLKPLIRRDFLERHSLRYDARLRLGEDYVLYARALALGARFVTTPARGYVAVEREGSLSGQHGTQDLAAFYMACQALADEPGLKLQDRRALNAQARSVRRRLALRQVLDIKRERGLWAALSWLAGNLVDAPSVVAQIARDKLQA